MDKQPCVYILASKRHGALYIGVTSDLIQRIYQHKQKLVEGFTKKYNVNQLVYFEIHEDMYEAITREKQLKVLSKSKWYLNGNRNPMEMDPKLFQR